MNAYTSMPVTRVSATCADCHAMTVEEQTEKAARAARHQESLYALRVEQGPAATLGIPKDPNAALIVEWLATQADPIARLCCYAALMLQYYDRDGSPSPFVFGYGPIGTLLAPFVRDGERSIGHLQVHWKADEVAEWWAHQALARGLPLDGHVEAIVKPGRRRNVYGPRAGWSFTQGSTHTVGRDHTLWILGDGTPWFGLVRHANITWGALRQMALRLKLIPPEIHSLRPTPRVTYS